MTKKSAATLQAEMLAQLKKVMDPELGVSLVDLGLIYETSLSKEGIANIRMTLTTMGCPLFPVIEKDIENHLMEIEEVNDVKIELTFDPPWNPSMMTDEAKAQLGWN
jgi:metal-sulfur cluster biosynthetic enzyme